MGWHDNEYRERAEFCRKKAEEAKYHDIRADWLNLAALWLAMITTSPDREADQQRVA